MSRLNILNKQGYLTDEERKESLYHDCEWLSFRTNMDLTAPIKVTAFGSHGKITVEQYSRDVASFICWWTNFVHGDLNGFSGFNHLKFEFTNFELV